jgi:tetratricopeptide (TPR) repeat protein
MRTLPLACLVALAALVGCSAQSAPALTPAKDKSAAVEPKKRTHKPLPPLAAATAAFEKSDYAAAEALFQEALQDPTAAAAASVGLARVQAITGRYELSASPAGDGSAVEAGRQIVRASSLRAVGKVEQAVTLLRGLKPASAEARLLLGELLLEMGQVDAARPALMSLVEDYNDDHISDDDTAGLAMVGRAAHFLRSPEDANDAFNQAELAGARDARTLLWRAELYLDKYDTGHAQQVTQEVLERAPHHPDALVMMAEVHLEQANDFEQAKALIADALKVNPRHSRAHGVLAGIAIRDMHLERAEEHVNDGLETNPRDLVLLSLLGTVRFLEDDQPGFEAVQQQVLALNPHYSAFYQTVGKYADWEHRYDEIVAMMRQALAIDADDAGAQAALGINLIRNGDDRGGLSALQRAFAKDPYNVRVFNTLSLYEKVIPTSYVDVSSGVFRLRYPRAEQAILERYVPRLLEQAWNKMQSYYDFTPSQPIGVELYAERENFAIRTSGLPRTAIQGVCFGKTLAAMTPRHEDFNLAMTLWHELAHVFHIQLSRNRVPRWFTEGLAEYETIVERKEWSREQDQELYLALREGRLPSLAAMNEAFTHAEDGSDVALAYYASSQIVEMLAQNYGRAKLRQMLVLWSEGKRTEEVLHGALGKSSQQLDEEVRAFLESRLARYSKQFVPMRRVGDPRRVHAAAEAAPDDPEAQLRLALLALRHDQAGLARHALDAVLKAEPKNPHAIWLKAKIALQQGNSLLAQAQLQRLVDQGQDGYEVQVLRARAALEQQAAPEVEDALRRAHAFDPSEAEPIHGLLDRSKRDPVQRMAWLERLGELEEHKGEVYKELTVALTQAKRFDDALLAGQAGIYAALEDPGVHVAYAGALAAAGKAKQAEFEFESALLCPAPPKALAEAHLAYAAYLRAAGRVKAAEAQTERAATLTQPPADPAAH